MNKKKYNLTPESQAEIDMQNIAVDKEFYSAINNYKAQYKDDPKKLTLMLHNILLSSVGYEQAISKVLDLLYYMKTDSVAKEEMSKLTAEQIINDLGHTLSFSTPDITELRLDVEKLLKDNSDIEMKFEDLYNIGEENPKK